MISIITPVYNVERFLPCMIESVLAQSEQDWELLLIDDGSTDTSGSLCDDYAKRDKRIKVFHQENGGVSRARNLGLMHALGEYVTFLDSDDMWTSDFLQKIIKLAQVHDVDLASLWRVFIDEVCKQPVQDASAVGHNRFYDQHNMSNLFEECPDFFTVVWGKLYKMSLIRKYNLRFNEQMCMGEDVLFLASYFTICKTVGLNTVESYNYRIRDNSLVRSIHNNMFEMDLCRFVSYAEFVNSYEHSEVKADIYQTQFISTLIHSLVQCNSIDILKSRIRTLTTNAPFLEISFRNRKSFPKSIYLVVLLLRFSPRWFLPYLLWFIKKSV